MELGPVHRIRDDIVARIGRPLAAPCVELDLLLLSLTPLKYRLRIHVHCSLYLQLLMAPPLHPFEQGLLQQRLIDVGQESVQGLVHVHVNQVHRCWVCVGG